MGEGCKGSGEAVDTREAGRVSARVAYLPRWAFSPDRWPPVVPVRTLTLARTPDCATVRLEEMTRLPDWQLREILPALVVVARASPTPNRALDATITELVALAERRGLRATLTRLERSADIPDAPIPWHAVLPRNGEGSTFADPSPAVDPSPKA